MPHRVNCPSCQSALTIGDDLLGQKVRCRECSQVFQAGELPVRKPRRPASSLVLDEEPQEEERPRRRRRDADEENPEEEKKSSAGLILVLGGVFLVLLLGGGGVGAYFWFSGKEGPKQTEAVTDSGDGKKTVAKNGPADTDGPRNSDGPDDPPEKDDSGPVVIPSVAPAPNLPVQRIGESGPVVSNSPTDKPGPDGGDLVITSSPPPRAEPGKSWSYPLAVKSSKGPVRAKLTAGPPGMKVSDDLKVTWTVPAQPQEKEVGVALTISDGGGQEKVHSFKIRLDNGTGADTPPLVAKSVLLDEVTWDFPAPQRVKLEPPLLAGGVGRAPPVPLRLPLSRRPSVATDLVVGGGGRYVILHFPRDKRVGVFDVTKKAIVKAFAVDDETVLLAAGMDRLIVVLAGAKTIQRYSLSKLELEKSAPLPTKEKAVDLVMGSSSAGPLLLWERGSTKETERQKSFHFIDPETFEVLATPGLAGLPARLAGGGSLRSIAASGNGRVFVFRTRSQLHTVVRQGWFLTAHRSDPKEFDGASYALPSEDGQVICTDKGPFDERCTKLGTGTEVATLPAAHGPFYVSDTGAYLRGQAKSLRPMPRRSAVEKEGLGANNPVPMETRFILVPGASVLLFLGGSNAHLWYSRFDLYSGMKSLDYLYVTSLPPNPIKSGLDFTYRVTVASKKGGVKMRLLEGPAELKVAEDGAVTWKAPEVKEAKEVSVKVGIGDDSKQEIQHTFAITVLPVAAKTGE